MATKQMSKKRKFVHDGVLYAELNEFLQKELAEDGYAGVEIRRTPMRTEIIIRATRTQNVLGELTDEELVELGEEDAVRDELLEWRRGENVQVSESRGAWVEKQSAGGGGKP